MGNSYNSLFNLIYNRANNIKEDNLDIECTASVSFLDAFKCKRVKVKVDVQTKCECLSNEYIDSFYEECDKCSGNGKVVLNGFDVICNRCDGRGKLLKIVCPLCNGKMYVLHKEDMFINLNKEEDVIVKGKGLTINGKTGDLCIHIDVYDKDAYVIEGKDVYCKKIIDFKKNEFDKSKDVETCVDVSKIKLSEIKYLNVIKLNGKGIDGGDFYQPVRCEVKGEKGKDVYKNVILTSKCESFYIHREEIYSSDAFMRVYEYKPLNDDNYEVIHVDNCNSYSTIKLECKGMKGKNNGENGDLYLQVFVGDYSVINGDVYLNKCELSKNELSTGKKSIVVNGTKINVAYDKKSTSNYFQDMGNYGALLGKDKKSKLFIRIPVGSETYNITVNKKTGYVKDYKKFFNEDVKVYSSNHNLEEYICINGETVVYDNDGNKVNVTYRKGVK